MNTDNRTSEFVKVVSGLFVGFGLLVVLRYAGFFLGMYFFGKMYNLPIEETMNIMRILQPDALYRTGFIVVQGVGSAFAFLGAWLFVRLAIDKTDLRLLYTQNATIMGYLLAIVAIVASAPFISAVIEFNRFNFAPSVQQAFEPFKASHQRIEQITAYLAHFETPNQWLVGLLAMALIPAIGEELFFRQYVQTSIGKLLNNAHLGIWISALLFSAVHMQVFLFFPRLLLGAVLGYVFYYSRDIKVSILSHFVNNATTLIVLNMYGQHQMGYSIWAIPSVVVVIGALLLQHKLHKAK